MGKAGGCTMKRQLSYLLLAICLLGLAGCSKKESQTINQKDFKENTTIINADGTVQSVIVECFDKDYYQTNELKSYIETTVQNYTKKAGNDSVVLDSLNVNDKMATAQFSFKKMSDYATFNAIESEVLTNEQALKDERVSATVYSVEDGETISLQSALKDKEYKILVTGLLGENIITESKIAYYTNGTLTGDNLLKTGSEGITVIIYE